MKTILIALSLSFAVAVSAAPTLSNGPSSKLVGQWNGRSLCVTPRPACTDETVQYHIRKDKPDAENFHIQADKVVNGQVQNMGELVCRFEALRQQLICPQGQGQWQFRWDGDTLVGGLLADDGSLFRLISVRRKTG